jgi:hypothetical protein
MVRSHDYNERYRRFSLRMEKLLIALIIFLSFLLLTGELAYQIDALRPYLIETERLEGTSQMP